MSESESRSESERKEVKKWMGSFVKDRVVSNLKS